MKTRIDYKDVVARIRSYGYVHGVLGIGVDSTFPDEDFEKFFQTKGVYTVREKIRRDVFLETFIKKTEASRAKGKMIFAYADKKMKWMLLFEIDLETMTFVEPESEPKFYKKYLVNSKVCFTFVKIR